MKKKIKHISKLDHVKKELPNTHISKVLSLDLYIFSNVFIVVDHFQIFSIFRPTIFTKYSQWNISATNDLIFHKF